MTSLVFIDIFFFFFFFFYFFFFFFHFFLDDIFNRRRRRHHHLRRRRLLLFFIIFFFFFSFSGWLRPRTKQIVTSGGVPVFHSRFARLRWILFLFFFFRPGVCRMERKISSGGNPFLFCRGRGWKHPSAFHVGITNHSRVRRLSSIVRKIRGKNLVSFIHAFLMQLARQTHFRSVPMETFLLPIVEAHASTYRRCRRRFKLCLTESTLHGFFQSFDQRVFTPSRVYFPLSARRS